MDVLNHKMLFYDQISWQKEILIHFLPCRTHALKIRSSCQRFHLISMSVSKFSVWDIIFLNIIFWYIVFLFPSAIFDLFLSCDPTLNRIVAFPKFEKRINVVSAVSIAFSSEKSTRLFVRLLIILLFFW